MKVEIKERKWRWSEQSCNNRIVSYQEKPLNRTLKVKEEELGQGCIVLRKAKCAKKCWQELKILSADS